MAIQLQSPVTPAVGDSIMVVKDNRHARTPSYHKGTSLVAGLKRVRTAAGLTMNDLAVLTNINYGVIASVLQGRFSSGANLMDCIATMADKLGISVSHVPANPAQEMLRIIEAELDRREQQANPDCIVVTKPLGLTWGNQLDEILAGINPKDRNRIGKIVCDTVADFTTKTQPRCESAT